MIEIHIQLNDMSQETLKYRSIWYIGSRSTSIAKNTATNARNPPTHPTHHTPHRPTVQAQWSWLPDWHTSWSGFSPLRYDQLTLRDSINEIAHMLKWFPRRYAQKIARGWGLSQSNHMKNVKNLHHKIPLTKTFMVQLKLWPLIRA